MILVLPAWRKSSEVNVKFDELNGLYFLVKLTSSLEILVEICILLVISRRPNRKEGGFLPSFRYKVNE